LITRLGKQKIILGLSWLQNANPNINWKTGKITWKKTMRNSRTTIEEEDEDPKDLINDLE
jgi:hypothetical protein